MVEDDVVGRNRRLGGIPVDCDVHVGRLPEPHPTEDQVVRVNGDLAPGDLDASTRSSLPRDRQVGVVDAQAGGQVDRPARSEYDDARPGCGQCGTKAPGAAVIGIRHLIDRGRGGSPADGIRPPPLGAREGR